MTMVHSRSVPRVALRQEQPTGRPTRLVALLRGWVKRARERRELAGLNDEQLRDVGLNRLMVKREVEKPFWMA
jgi:uncharacterized protein YjiS (DUF1127 family)